MKSYGNVIGRLILAVSLSVVWIVAVLGWVRHFGRTGPQAAAKEPSDSMAIVVDAEVKKWQPIMSDGPSDATKPDHPINVVDDVGVIGEDNWIVRFTVTKGVNGEFDSEGVQMLIHSPSRDGITREGQRFVLCLAPRSEPPEVIASSKRRLAQGLSYFTFAKTLYQLNSDDPRSTYPAGAH